MIEVREYNDRAGRDHFGRWYNCLDPQSAARAAAALFRPEHGNLSNVKAVGRGVHEYRIYVGPGYRVSFGSEREQAMILLCGGSKKSKQKDVERAQALWTEYKGRKKEKGV